MKTKGRRKQDQKFWEESGLGRQGGARPGFRPHFFQEALPQAGIGDGGGAEAKNVGLAVFNLLPAFPMDGGRILRNLLAFWMSPLRATQIAAGLGQMMSLLFFFFGLFFNPFLILIALFIWMGAAAEASTAQVKAGIAGVPVQEAMITNFQVLSPNDTLAQAADHIIAGFQQDFPVVEGGRLVGVLTRSDLLKALSQRGRETPVRQAMQDKFEIADPSEPLDEAFTRLQNSTCRALPVVKEDKIVGILTPENIGEFLMIREAERSGSRR